MNKWRVWRNLYLELYVRDRHRWVAEQQGGRSQRFFSTHAEALAYAVGQASITCPECGRA